MTVNFMAGTINSYFDELFLYSHRDTVKMEEQKRAHEFLEKLNASLYKVDDASIRHSFLKFFTRRAYLLKNNVNFHSSLDDSIFEKKVNKLYEDSTYLLEMFEDTVLNY